MRLFTLVVFVALCVPRMLEPIWYDELWATRLKVGELPLLLTSAYKDVHPPLHYVGMAAWIQLLGDSEWSIRMPSLLAGIGAILLAAPVGAVLVGAEAGQLLAALLALSPVHVWYATEARPYSLNLFLTLLLVLAFERLRAGDPRRRWRWLYWLAACAGPLSHYYLAIPVGVCALLALRGPARLVRTALPAAAVGALLVVGFLLAMSRLSTLRTEMGYLRWFDWHQAWLLLSSWLPTGNAWQALTATVPHVDPPADAASWPWAAPVLLLGLAAAWLVRSAPGRRRVLLHAAVLPVFLGLMPLLGTGRSYAERSVLPILPFVLLILAAGAVRHRRAVVTLLVLQLGCTLLVLTHPDRTTVHLPRADYRSAAAWLADDLRDARAGEVRWALDTRAFSSARVLGYYDDRIEERALLDTDPREALKVTARIDAALGRWPWLRDGLREVVSAQFAGLTRWKERRLAANRIRLDRLDVQVDDLALRVRGQSVFYLLCHPEDEQDEASHVPQVLRDPRFRVTARVVFRRLWVYRVAVGP